MKKSVISLRHPETLYIKQPIFRNKRKHCLIIALNHEVLWKILDSLRLAELITFYESFRSRKRYAEMARNFMNYLIVTRRLYSKWEEKQFLDLLLADLRYRWSPETPRRRDESRVSTKSHMGSSSSMMELKMDESGNDGSRIMRNKEAIGHDVERTNLRPQMSESVKRSLNGNGNKTGSQFLNAKQAKKGSKVTVSEVEKMQEYMNRVLTEILRRFPRLGYIQGFNCIVKNMYLTGLSEDEAFHYSCFLIAEKRLGELILNNMHGLKQLSYVLKIYIFNYVPTVYRHLELLEVEPQIFATSWFITLFSEDLPPTFVNKLWHLFILQGWKTCIQFGISILCSFQKEILSQPADEIFTFLRRLISHFRLEAQRCPEVADNVWKLMASVEVNGWMVEELCRSMDDLHRDTEIEIWRLKNDQPTKPPLERSLSSFSMSNGASRLEVGPQWCCQKPLNTSVTDQPLRNCEAGLLFPFCNNVSTPSEVLR